MPQLNVFSPLMAPVGASRRIIVDWRKRWEWKKGERKQNRGEKGKEEWSASLWENRNGGVRERGHPQLIISRRMRIQFLNDDHWGEFCHSAFPTCESWSVISSRDFNDVSRRWQEGEEGGREEEERERRIKPRIYWQLDGSEACRVGDTGQLATLRYLCPFPFSGGSCSCLVLPPSLFSFLFAIRGKETVRWIGTRKVEGFSIVGDWN